MTWATFLKEKSEALEKFKAFKVLVENEKDWKIKCFCFDNGGEFNSNKLFSCCERTGIKRHILAPKTPKHNGSRNGPKHDE